LRKLAGVVKEEMNAMPIQIDLMENEIAVPRRQIEKRFGVMPERWRSC
jgi:hypothetical protein